MCQLPIFQIVLIEIYIYYHLLRIVLVTLALDISDVLVSGHRCNIVALLLNLDIVVLSQDPDILQCDDAISLDNCKIIGMSLES